jgi:hypothetical protein
MKSKFIAAIICIFYLSSPTGSNPEGHKTSVSSYALSVQTENEFAAPGIKSNSSNSSNSSNWKRVYITFYCKACNTPRNSTQTSSGIPLKRDVVNFAAPKSLRYLMGKEIEVRFRDTVYRGIVTDKCGTKALDIHTGKNWTTQCKCYPVGYGEWRLIR